MWNKPTDKQLAELPKFYATEKIPIQKKVIKIHFFMGGSDWYAVEYDPVDQIFFGFVILNSDYDNAEWGYFSLKELLEVKNGLLEIDRDLHWQDKEVGMIGKIQKGRG